MAFAVPAAEVAGAAKKAAAAKTATKKAAPGDGGAGKPAAKQAPAKQAPAKQAPAKQAPAKQAPAGQAPPLVAREKRTKPALTLPHPVSAAKWLFSGNMKLLTAEYIACVAVLGAGTLLAPQGSKDGTVRAMVKFTALSALFFLLALVASAGKGAARGATALGALVTAAYLFTSSDVHDVANWVAVFFDPKGDVTPRQPGGSGPTLQQQAQSVQALGQGVAAVAGAVGEMLPGGNVQEVYQGVTGEGAVGPGGTYTSTTGFGY